MKHVIILQKNVVAYRGYAKNSNCDNKQYS